MKKPTEQTLIRQLLEYLRLQGHFAWRQNQGAMAGTYQGKRRFVRFAGIEGIADIIGVLGRGSAWPGRFLAVEGKIRPNRPTAAQAVFLGAVNAAGGLGVVAYDLDDLRRALGDLAMNQKGG